MVAHESLQAGDACPSCQTGTVYRVKSGVVLRIVGQPPVSATIYDLEKLRCHLCGTTFTAKEPDGIGDRKYDATAASMIALLKYGSGLPFNRLSRLQRSLGTPLAAATQWDVIHDASRALVPAYRQLIHQAAQGEVVYNDDTTVKILELMGKRQTRQSPEQLASAPKNKDGSPRKGLYTSGIVSTAGGRRIALFLSGRQHAGENLADVLRQRDAELSAPIQMCDGLARNLPEPLATILANCLSHARRDFVDLTNRFGEECFHVLTQLAMVYAVDQQAQDEQLSPLDRLALHQAQSGPVMQALKDWIERQFNERRQEPNSALGSAMTYLLKHWEPLTLFLRQPGAPLDNNLCERILKKAILLRKNSLFYRTEHGAQIGDLYLSLIHTCELNGVNPFDYLTTLQRHATHVAADPARWMPWNYGESLAALRCDVA